MEGNEVRSPMRGVGLGEGCRLGVLELSPDRDPEGVISEPEFRSSGFGPCFGLSSTLELPLNAAKAACSGFLVSVSALADGMFGR